MKNLDSRRRFIKHSSIGLLAVSAGNMVYGRSMDSSFQAPKEEGLPERYPSIDYNMVKEVVGAAHSKFERVKELVINRPELALSTWDWGFGDFESAIGAAAHMGRRDIAAFLMEYGARPDIFTYAMLSSLEVVKAMIESTPGIQRIPGPHGITLLQHAKNRLRHRDVPKEQIANSQRLIEYLESLGDADMRAQSLDISEEEKAIYMGNYRFGSGEDEVFEIGLNMRKLLQIGRKGTFGRTMNRVGDNLFAPGGAPSVRISFVIKDGKAISLTINEPNPVLTAVRI